MAKKECKDHQGNVYASVKDMCAFWNVDYRLYRTRISSGMSVEKALTLPRQDGVFHGEKQIDHLGNIFNSQKEMCKHWNIPCSIYQKRRKQGLSMEEALSANFKGRSCKDHLGNEFKTIKEMCSFWNISERLYFRRIKENMSIKDALTLPKDYKNICKDHLGNEFKTTKEMCAFWNIDYKIYKSRKKRGKSLEESLSSPVHARKGCIDHLNNKFESVEEMCKYWGVSRSVFDKHMKMGWNLEDALTYSGRSCEDHLGNKFSNISAMAEYWNLKDSTVYNRLRMGWSLEKTLTSPFTPLSSRGGNTAKECKDHLGNTYSSLVEMCKNWDIDDNLIRNRLKQGWSLEKALTAPLLSPKDYNRKKCKDHLGKEFLCINKMCEYYHIDTCTFYSRIKSGWSVKKALTYPVHIRTCVDHKGNEFKTAKEMCSHWNVPYRTFCTRKAEGWALERALTTPLLSPKDYNGKKCKDHLGMEYESMVAMCNHYCIPVDRFTSRIESAKYTLEEALTLPKNMYLGEYRVAEALKRLDVKFYHDCTIKRVFEDLQVPVDWTEFLTELQNNYKAAGFDWTKKSIERLRPDFVLYTDENNRIRGVIEFDGAQHQKLVDKFFKTVEDFFRRSDADFVKQSLWEYLKIPMLRIRDDQIDMIDEMVENFIAFPEDYIENHNTYLDNEEYWAGLEEEKDRLRKLEAETKEDPEFGLKNVS